MVKKITGPILALLVIASAFLSCSPPAASQSELRQLQSEVQALNDTLAWTQQRLLETENTAINAQNQVSQLHNEVEQLKTEPTATITTVATPIGYTSQFYNLARLSYYYPEPYIYPSYTTPYKYTPYYNPCPSPCPPPHPPCPSPCPQPHPPFPGPCPSPCPPPHPPFPGPNPCPFPPPPPGISPSASTPALLTQPTQLEQLVSTPGYISTLNTIQIPQVPAPQTVMQPPSITVPAPPAVVQPTNLQGMAINF